MIQLMAEQQSLKISWYFMHATSIFVERNNMYRLYINVRAAYIHNIYSGNKFSLKHTELILSEVVIIILNITSEALDL